MRVTFLSVWSGDAKFSPDYLAHLKSGILRCLSSHDNPRFICISPKDTTPFGWEQEQTVPMPFKDEEGCWPKLQLFRLRIGSCMYFDLDSIIVKDIISLVPAADDARLHAWRDPWRRTADGKPHLNSACMAWNGWSPIVTAVWDARNARAKSSQRFGKPNGQWNGDQDFTREHVLYWTPLDGIKSYKADCNQNRIPEDAKVIAFHGKPKNEDVDPGGPYGLLWRTGAV